MMQSSYITGEHYRITVLTPALIRLEYSHQGRFEDRPTQVIQNRSFPVPDYQVWKTEHGIELHTDSLNLFYDEKPFSRNGLWIENRSGEFIVPGILETNCMKIWVAQPERWMKQTAQSLSSREFYLVYRGTVYWMTAIRMH